MTGSGRDGLIYSVSLVLPRLPGFLFLPFFAARLSFAEMGVLATCWIFMDLFQHFAGLGMRQALGRFFPLAETLRDRREVLTTALWTACAGGVAASLLTWAAWSLPALRGSLEFLSALDGRLLASLLAASSLGNLSSTLVVYFRAERRPWAFLAAGAAGAAVEMALVGALLAGEGLRVADLMAVEAVKQAVILLWVAWLGRRDLAPAFARERWAALLPFALWLVPVGLCEWAVLSADRFWLGQLEGLDPVGVYGFFARFATPLSVIFTGYLMEMHSFLFAMRGGEGIAFVRDRLERFLLRGGCLALALSILFPAAYRAAEALWPEFPRGYAAGLPVFPILVAGLYAIIWGRYYGAALEYRFRARAVLFALGLSAAASTVLLPAAIAACRHLGWSVLAGAAAASLLAILAGTAAQGAMAGIGEGGSGRQIALGSAFLLGCLAVSAVLFAIG